MHHRFVLLLLAAPLWAGEEDFTGRIVFEQSAEGAQAKAFRGLAAQKITIHFGRAAYRQDDAGGLSDGSAIVRYGLRKALRLDYGAKTSEWGMVSDLDTMDKDVRALRARHFRTELEATDATATIAGYETRRYRVKDSERRRAEIDRRVPRRLRSNDQRQEVTREERTDGD